MSVPPTSRRHATHAVTLTTAGTGWKAVQQVNAAGRHLGTFRPPMSAPGRAR
ncbi:hypothetical protein ACFCVY_06200 [Streptomyces sp. NPDC056411]|uniref:hypothetical protein n=1 Tax=Streptomyces sp. NPDC056411 TaxID=3345813 RepID=UPI0035D7EA83